MMNTILVISVTVVLMLVGLYSSAYLIQKKMIFAGFKTNPELYQRLQSSLVTLPNYHPQLQGWKTAGAALNSEKIIVYFGGNAEDVATTSPLLRALPVAASFHFNYRGYGHSQSSPSETGVYQDALAIFDHVKTLYPQAEITIMGRSLGSAVAGYLASKRQAHSLILVTPLKSTEQIGRDMFKGIRLPDSLFFFRFQLVEYAENINVPALVVFAEHDEIIPAQHSQETFNNLAGPKQKVLLEGAGHNNLYDRADLISELNAFLN